MKYSHAFHVTHDNIDSQGHVNNVEYVKWIQDVAIAHWVFATDDAIRNRFSWILTRHEINYKKQTFENEEITATTWVGKAKRVTCERFTEISRGNDLLVEAKSTWCFIDRKTSKPARIILEVKEIFLMT